MSLLELLADRAQGELDPSDAERLQALLSSAGVDDDQSMDLAAAAAALAELPRMETPPPSVYTRAAQAAEMYARDLVNRTRIEGSPALRPAAEVAPNPVVWRIGGGWLGWLAAAACLAFAAVGWLSNFANRQRVPTSTTISLVALRHDLEKSPETAHLPWSDWDKPEIAGVKGEILWNPTRQKGVMVFKGLPANDPDREQYQLWIVDQRGLEQRVSGGIFNASGECKGWTGEVRGERVGDDLLVEVDPRIHVGPPKLFAITIEKPGGTWVSDMKRRVVVAAANN